MFNRMGGDIPWPVKVIMNVYVGGLCISMLYFNTMHIREHGFIDWMFFGEIVPSLKATVWPYYLIRTLSAEDPTTGLSSTREGLHTSDIPRLYPVLLEHIDSHGPLTVRWVTQTAEQESLTIRRGPTGEIIVETDYINTDGPLGVGGTRLVTCTLVDADADGEVDSAVFEDPAGVMDCPDARTDDLAQYMWDMSMTLTFTLGEPFR